MERLPRDTEMFAPNVTCVVVLNQNCGLSSTHVIFLLGHIFLCEWWKYVSVTILLPLSARNLSLCWNQFLRRKQTNCIKTVIKGRKTFNTSFIWISCHVIQTDSPASKLCSNYVYLMKFKYNSWKQLSFLSCLTKSVNKTPPGMLSETMVVVKTQPTFTF